MLTSNPDLLIHIPARAGSKRVPRKNLRLINGRPMISYAIQAALDSDITSSIFVNTDSPDIADYASTLNGVKLYLRDPDLASDDATGDQFTADIISNLTPKILMMISPVCPLVTPQIISDCYDSFKSKNVDTLITCNETRMQVACNQGFINVNPELPMPPSQFNSRVQICNWAVAIWECSSFITRYKNSNGAYLGFNRILFPIPQLNSFKVSYEDDFQVIQAIMSSSKANSMPTEPMYWSTSST